MSFYNKIINSISERYNIAFIEGLLSEKKIHCFIFGGFLRDAVLGKNWKDVDMRIAVDAPSVNEREKIVEDIIGKYRNEKYFKTRIDKSGVFSVIRFVPEGSVSDEYIDLTVSRSFDHPRSDYTINDLFYDLNRRMLIDRSGQGFRHLREKIVDTVIDPKEQFELCSWELPRAVKTAVQFDFEIHPRVERAVKGGREKITTILNLIKQNQDNEWSEYLLSCLFGGLKYNPFYYFELNKKLKIFENILSHLSFEIEGSFLTAGSRKKLNDMDNPFHSISSCELERSLSVVLSCLTDAFFGYKSEEHFDETCRVFNFNGQKMTGDFPIDCSKLEYQQVI